MDLKTVRALKTEIAEQIIRPLVTEIRAERRIVRSTAIRRLTGVEGGIALGIAAGDGKNDYRLAVRVQRRALETNAYLRQQMAARPAPEELSNTPAHVLEPIRKGSYDDRPGRGDRGDRPERAPRSDRFEQFESGAWFSLSVGRKQRAEPRWLLPLICKAGDITKTDVGSIKILETETRFEITASKADAFLARIKQYGTGEKGVNITRSEGAGSSSPRSDFKPKKSFGEKREWDDRKPPRARDDHPRDDKPKADWAAKPAKAKPEGWTAEKPEKVKKPKERKPGDPSGFDKYKAKKARKAAAGQPE